MKRVSFVHAGARIAVLAALALPLVVTAAPKPASPKPASSKAAPTTTTPPVSPPKKRDMSVTKNPKFKGWVNDTPDTGQFLPDSVWLLRVGPRVTTVGIFVEGWFRSYPEDRPGQDSLGRVTFLENLMSKDILGLTALSIEHTPTFEDRFELRSTRQRALASAVYRRFVADSVVVSEDEVKALWETYKWDQHLRHIMVSDKNAAEMVRREIVSGRLPWSAAAKKYSLIRSDQYPDGDMGWVSRDRMEPIIGNVVYSLKPGEISKPVHDTQGWHIVQSLERKPKSAPSYHAFRKKLRGELEQDRASVYAERIMEHLRQQEELRHDTATVILASKKFGIAVQIQPNDIGGTIKVDETIPEFSPADTAKLLATWRGGGRYSIGDLLHAYSDVPPLLRPALNVPEAVIAYIESYILEPKLADYGAQRGLEKDSVVVATLDKKREELAVGHMYQDSVARFIWVAKEERKAYYEKHKSQFHTFAKVTFAAIARSSKAGADSVAKQLTSGVPPAQVIAADSAAGLRSGTIQTRSQADRGAYHGALFEEMRKGDVQVRGPDKDGYYAILQVLDYDPGQQLSYEESETMIDESLQNQKSEAALKALIGRLKPRYKIASRPELLPLVLMLDPSLRD
jgi:parvulin-like peptidyl-prolyl isomerase